MEILLWLARPILPRYATLAGRGASIVAFVCALLTMAFIGIAPFGSLIAGALANTIGARNTLLIGGVSCLAGGGLFAFNLPDIRKKVRPIYLKMGIN